MKFGFAIFDRIYFENQLVNDKMLKNKLLLGANRIIAAIRASNGM